MRTSTSAGQRDGRDHVDHEEGDQLVTVGELITWLTAEAAMLPGGLDSQVLGGVDDDVESVASVYVEMEVTPFELGRGRGAALWVRGAARLPVES